MRNVSIIWDEKGKEERKKISGMRKAKRKDGKKKKKKKLELSCFWVLRWRRKKERRGGEEGKIERKGDRLERVC